jgi:carbon monoxide dehydrogenase subunit G
MEATMTVLREELDVDRSLEEVFALVGDFANAERWDPGVASSHAATEGPVGVGSRYDLIVLFNGRRLPMTYEVTAYEPPHHVVLKGSGSTVNAMDDIRFEATDQGTRIRYTADLRLKGPLRLLEPAMRGKFAAVGRSAMMGMREALEGGKASKVDLSDDGSVGT